MTVARTLALAALLSLVAGVSWAQGCGGTNGSCRMSDEPKEALFPDEEEARKKERAAQTAMCPCCRRMMKGGGMKGMMNRQAPPAGQKAEPAPSDGETCH